jgi:hypothetical protein
MVGLSMRILAALSAVIPTLLSLVVNFGYVSKRL